MKLGIFGDSFADVNSPIVNLVDQPWPATLVKLLGAVPTYYSMSATSTWWSYCRFLKEFKKFDKIVFCFSEHNRWQVLPEHLVRCAHIRDPNQIQFQPVEQRSELEALTKVFNWITSEDLNVFIQQHIFNDVQSRCKHHNIQLVNLMPFESDSGIIDLSMRAGPVLTGAAQLSGDELQHLSSKIAVQHFHGPDSRFCHLNGYNNTRLAEIMYDSFNTSEIINLRQVTGFSFSPEHLLPLITMEQKT